MGKKDLKGEKKGRNTQKASRGINQRFKKRRRNEKNKYIIVPVPVVENIFFLPLNFFYLCFKPIYHTNVDLFEFSISSLLTLMQLPDCFYYYIIKVNVKISLVYVLQIRTVFPSCFDCSESFAFSLAF